MIILNISLRNDVLNISSTYYNPETIRRYMIECIYDEFRIINCASLNLYSITSELDQEILFQVEI